MRNQKPLWWHCKVQWQHRGGKQEQNENSNPTCAKWAASRGGSEKKTTRENKQLTCAGVKKDENINQPVHYAGGSH